MALKQWNAKQQAEYDAKSPAEKLAVNVMGLGVLCLLAYGCWAAGDEKPIASRPITPLQAADRKVAKDAVLLMDRANFPRFYTLLGKDRFNEANALVPWAARAAAESNQCDQVTIAGQSDKTTRKRLLWYIDCANEERFMVDEQQARATRGRLDPSAEAHDKRLAAKLPVAEPKSARWGDFSEAVAISKCDELVSASALNRGSVDFGWRWESERNDETGVVTFQRDFDAANAMGGKISSRYHCEVNADRGGVSKLMIRELSGWRKLI